MNIFDLIRRKTGSININGRVFTGNQVTISAGGVITVDGVVQDDAALVGPVNVNVVGDVEYLKATSGSVSVSGNANDIQLTSGDVLVEGDVKGFVNTTSGDVTCLNVHGSASTVSGDISRKFLK